MYKKVEKRIEEIGKKEKKGINVIASKRQIGK